MAGITRILAAGLAVFVATSTSPSAQADHATTWTAIALAESGGRTDAKRPAKGVKVNTVAKKQPKWFVDQALSVKKR